MYKENDMSPKIGDYRIIENGLGLFIIESFQATYNDWMRYDILYPENKPNINNEFTSLDKAFANLMNFKLLKLNKTPKVILLMFGILIKKKQWLQCLIVI